MKIYQHYEKIKKCIESSKTQKHLDSCERMINTFKNRIGTEVYFAKGFWNLKILVISKQKEL